MFKYSTITNSATNESKRIDLNLTKQFAKDALIGGGIVLLGFIYLALASFSNGAEAYERGELKVLVDLGLTPDLSRGDKEIGERIITE